MKKIGFIGAYDKTDLLLCIAKMLTLMNNKVLIVDSTINQKAKYVVPAISPSKSYITNYENIDISVGLYSFKELENYLGVESFDKAGYTHVLIDIDNSDLIEQFELVNADYNYFVTGFDPFTLKKGVEVLSSIRMPLTLTKVLFSNNTEQADDEYLNYLSLGMRVQWAENRIYFPINNDDRDKLVESEKVAKITLKDLSKEFKQSLCFIAARISGAGDGEVKRVLKQLEKDNDGGSKWQ